MQTVEIELNELPYEMNEELKLLRTNLQFCGTDKKVLMLTSPVANEGKSTVTLELCRALTDLGKKVLLVDLDMRKSVFKHKVVGQTPETGLSHYLSGQNTLNEVTYGTNVQGLSIIFSGIVPPNPTELLSNQKMKHLVDSARNVCDYVILDCPPLGMVVDAAIVAPLCDGAMIVIEAGGDKYRLAQDVTAQLKNTGCPILGVILNKVDRRKGKGYYNKYYGKKYKGYYEY